MRTALDVKLAQLQSASGIQDAVAIAEVKNQVEDIAYHQDQEVPYNLTDSERLEYGDKSKMHSQHIATLEKHRGNVYALIYGQCAQILQDKMKQDKNWATVSVSYKPLELYKLIEQVILKQTEDQYPVAALWEQLSNVANVKQGNSTNNEWYDWFNTKVVGGPQEKMSFFQIASGPILSIPIHSKTCLYYGRCKFLLKKMTPSLPMNPPKSAFFSFIPANKITCF